MKIKRIILYLLTVFIGFAATAQEAIFNADFTLGWKGIETWTAGSNSRKVVAFTDAVYPDETQLPYFRKRVVVDKN